VPRPETEVMTGWAIEQLRPMVYAVARGRSRHLPVWWSSVPDQVLLPSPSPPN
jgi:hypothetical protein